MKGLERRTGGPWLRFLRDHCGYCESTDQAAGSKEEGRSELGGCGSGPGQDKEVGKGGRDEDEEVGQEIRWLVGCRQFS